MIEFDQKQNDASLLGGYLERLKLRPEACFFVGHCLADVTQQDKEAQQELLQRLAMFVYEYENKEGSSAENHDNEYEQNHACEFAASLQKLELLPRAAVFVDRYLAKLDENKRKELHRHFDEDVKGEQGF